MLPKASASNEATHVAHSQQFKNDLCSWLCARCQADQAPLKHSPCECSGAHMAHCEKCMLHHISVSKHIQTKGYLTSMYLQPSQSVFNRGTNKYCATCGHIKKGQVYLSAALRMLFFSFQPSFFRVNSSTARLVAQQRRYYDGTGNYGHHDAQLRRVGKLQGRECQYSILPVDLIEKNSQIMPNQLLKFSFQCGTSFRNQSIKTWHVETAELCTH